MIVIQSSNITPLGSGTENGVRMQKMYQIMPYMYMPLITDADTDANADASGDDIAVVSQIHHHQPTL